MPEADNPGAWIVTVMKDGTLYFGTNPVTPDGLADTMKRTPRNRTAKLYIKADAGAPFASVEQVLDAARADFFNTAVLLTSQPESYAPGKIVPPKGLHVSIGPESIVGAVVVQLVSAGQALPKLKVDGQQIERSELKTTLERRWEEPSIKLVLIRADRNVEFNDVAHLIDVCSSMDANVTLPKPE
jgi:biopolymer transport protein ExbD